MLYHNQVYKSLDTRYVLSQMQSVEQQPLIAWNIARMRLNPSKPQQMNNLASLSTPHLYN